MDLNLTDSDFDGQREYFRDQDNANKYDHAITLNNTGILIIISSFF